MGHREFFVFSDGSNVREAYDAARAKAQARREQYPALFSEARSFVWLIVPYGQGAFHYAEELIESGDERVVNNRGIIGCVQVRGSSGGDKTTWLFFGAEREET